MGPDRVSLDASAYPSLAHLVVRYADDDTRLALLNTSLSWHKEVHRVFCQDSPAIDVYPDPCGWRGFLVRRSRRVAWGFSDRDLDRHLSSWADVEYMTINAQLGYSREPHHSVCTWHGSEGKARHLAERLAKPQFPLPEHSPEDHDNVLFSGLHGSTAAQLRNLEEALHACKTITVHGPLSPLSYLFLQRYRFDTLRINGFGQDNDFGIPLSAKTITITLTPPRSSSFDTDHPVIKIPEETVSLKIFVDIKEPSQGPQSDDEQSDTEDMTTDESDDEELDNDKYEMFDSENENMVSNEGEADNGPSEPDNNEVDEEDDDMVPTFPSLCGPQSLRHLCLVFPLRGSYQGGYVWSSYILLHFLRQLLCSILSLSPVIHCTLVDLEYFKSPSRYTEPEDTLTEGILNAFWIGDVDIVVDWFLEGSREWDRPTVIKALRNLEILDRDEYLDKYC